MTKYEKPVCAPTEGYAEGVYCASGATSRSACCSTVVESQRNLSGMKSITLATSHVATDHEWGTFTIEIHFNKDIPSTVTVGGAFAASTVSGNVITLNGCAPNTSNPGYPSWHLLQLSGEGSEDLEIESIVSYCVG